MSTKVKRNEDIFSKNGIDMLFFLLMLCVAIVGLLMQLTAGAPFSYFKNGDSFAFIKTQTLYSVILLGMAYVASRFNYRLLKYVSTPLWLLFFVMLIGASLLGGDDMNRWLSIAGFNFQPSEFMKLSLILFLGFSLSKSCNKFENDSPSKAFIVKDINEFLKVKKIRQISVSQVTSVFYIAIIGLTSGAILAGSHLSGAILVALFGLAMLAMAGCRKSWFIFMGSVVLVFGGFAIWYCMLEEKPFEIPLLKEYMQERIVSWLDKDYSPSDGRWQINNSLGALGSGGFLGAGIGNSKQKYLYVAECHTDFIFSIIAEELGFVGCVLIIALFVLFIARGVYIGIHAKDRVGSFLVFGIMAQIAIQIVLNIAVITDTIPNTGIPLPFFSYGGTALSITYAEMAIVLSVSRQADLKKMYFVGKKKSMN